LREIKPSFFETSRETLKALAAPRFSACCSRRLMCPVFGPRFAMCLPYRLPLRWWDNMMRERQSERNRQAVPLPVEADVRLPRTRAFAKLNAASV